MKSIKIYLAILIVFLSLLMKVEAQSYNTLDINNVSAGFNADGCLFSDFINAQFEVPKGSNKHTIFAGAPWIGGIDNGGMLHVAAATYRQTGSDFFSGPHKDSASNSMTEYNHWNNIWKVNKSQIDSFKGWFANHAAYPGYVIPNVIASWPANPNIPIGEGPCLAPYFDANSDGHYDPADGDYPLIKGDQTLFYIFNDSDSTHSETIGPKMNVEIHAMAYAFNNPNDTILGNTIFLNYQIYNLSHNTYDSTYLGNFTDFDLGNFADDYVGCDVKRSAYFAYNGDPDDEGPMGYGFNPPAQAVVFLSGPPINPQDTFFNFQDSVIRNPPGTIPMTNFMSYKNDFSAEGNPNGGGQYFNYMKSIWTTNRHAIFGGDGYDSINVGTPNNYMFPDSTDSYGWGMNHTPPPYGWTEAQAGQSPTDVRGIGASGPFTFHPGQVICVDYAYVFSRANSGGPDASVAKMRTDIDHVRNFYINDSTLHLCSCSNINLGIPNHSDQQLLIKIYPNPFSTATTLTLQGTVRNPTLFIYNLLGQEVKSIPVGTNKQVTIPRNNLPAGMYFYKLVEENKEPLAIGKLLVE